MLISSSRVWRAFTVVEWSASACRPWGHRGGALHGEAGVGVADCELVGVDASLDDGGVTGDLPESSSALELRQELGFDGGESECGLGFGDLVRGLAEQDAGLGVGEEAHGDFGGGGAVIGLGSKVSDAVGDGDVGDAVVARQFLAGLVIAGDAFIAEERPDLFEDLDS